MSEDYIPLEGAAVFEDIQYNTFVQRMKRNPKDFKTKLIPRTDGGKPLVEVAVSSLTPKARRAWRAAEKAAGGDAPMETPEKAAPWYLEADLNQFIEGHKAEYYEKVELAGRVRAFLDYGDAERTAFAEAYAKELGTSVRTLYRNAGDLLEAEAWARRMEAQDGHSRDYFRVLALCRKPRVGGTFPSLPPEQKALIENIWFNKDFAPNRNTFENAYDAFQREAKKRGWDGLPSVKTVGRYITYIMRQPGAVSANYLVATGKAAWKNQYMVKCKRDATLLEVMELAVADAHTFDIWVSHTYPNGKVKAIRPVVVAWEDMRTRTIMGPVLCEHSNAQVVKESFVKMCYTHGVPKHIHTDNGKDFTAKEMLGQDRKVRYQQREKVEMDSETMGFYLSMGGTDWSRSLPYQPWDKAIERAFRTFCLRHSKKYKSYVGTLTGSKTGDKIQKDIPRMLDRGELLTMEEFYTLFMAFLEEDYHARVHRGLKDAGESWTTPASLFEHGERYEKAPPPREYAAMLLMKAETATVTSQGIHRFKSLYTADELGMYVNQKVGIKWDIDDVTKLYVYDMDGHKVCEAQSAEILSFGEHVSQEALERHKRRQNRQYSDTMEFLEEKQRPFEQRVAEGRDPGVVGKLDLMLGREPQKKVVTLPQDKEYRGEMAARQRGKRQESEFFAEKAEDALAQLRAL